MRYLSRVIFFIVITSVSAHSKNANYSVNFGNSAFDLAGYCMGADGNEIAPINQDFGIATVEGLKRPILLIDGYFAALERGGNFGGCLKHKAILLLDSPNDLGREIDDQTYRELRRELWQYSQAQSDSTYVGFGTSAGSSDPDDVVSCFLSVRWNKIGEKKYALFSTYQGNKKFDLVPQHDDASPGECFDWGGNAVVPKSVDSDIFGWFKTQNGNMFIIASNFSTAIALSQLQDINCVEGSNRSARHYVFEKKYFDKIIRPKLKMLFEKAKARADKNRLSFETSVVLNHDIANAIIKITQTKMTECTK